MKSISPFLENSLFLSPLFSKVFFEYLKRSSSVPDQGLTEVFKFSVHFISFRGSPPPLADSLLAPQWVQQWIIVQFAHFHDSSLWMVILRIW
jgi:hypothetical protein